GGCAARNAGVASPDGRLLHSPPLRRNAARTHDVLLLPRRGGVVGTSPQRRRRASAGSVCQPGIARNQRRNRLLWLAMGGRHSLGLYGTNLSRIGDGRQARARNRGTIQSPPLTEPETAGARTAPVRPSPPQPLLRCSLLDLLYELRDTL